MYVLIFQLYFPYLACISFWRRYVDDTISFVKLGSIEYIVAKLNGFHKNIQFTYEVGNNGKLPFFDVLLCKSNNNLTTTVYRKETHSNIYLHWDSFTPIAWKRGTLKTLVERAYLICSTPKLLEM